MAAKRAPVERKFIKVDQTQAVVSADTNAETASPEKTPKAKATSLRIFAVIAWLVAIGFEVIAILILNGTIYVQDLPGGVTAWLIVAIVLDLICVVVGSMLWKKSNRLDPVSNKNKIKFLLWNQMGVIAAIVAFLPLVVVLLKNKNMDAKTKKIVTVVAAVALVAAIGLGIDFNPPTKADEVKAQTNSTALGDGTAYWTRWGKSYHFDPDCFTIRNSAEVFQGTVEQAFAANRSDPCNFCALTEDDPNKEVAPTA